MKHFRSSNRIQGQTKESWKLRIQATQCQTLRCVRKAIAIASSTTCPRNEVCQRRLQSRMARHISQKPRNRQTSHALDWPDTLKHSWGDLPGRQRETSRQRDKERGKKGISLFSAVCEHERTRERKREREQEK